MSREEHLDHCVKAKINIHLVLKLCVDVKGARTYSTMYCMYAVLFVGWLLEMPPIVYHEPRGALSPPGTPRLVMGGVMPPPPTPSPEYKSPLSPTPSPEHKPIKFLYCPYIRPGRINGILRYVVLCNFDFNT